MTFTEVQTEVAERLNLTSTTALARIARSINEVYREVAVSIGLQTTSRATVQLNTIIGTPTLTFTGLQQITTLVAPTYLPSQPLAQVSVIEMRQRIPQTGDPARAYAIQTVSAKAVTVLLDRVPASAYALAADGISTQTTLSGVMEPAFPENYHNLLLEGAMKIELQKMEKYDMAAVHDAAFEKRLGELRFFLAKSAWLTIHQGKTPIGPGVIPEG
jgi:hypothetical protein